MRWLWISPWLLIALIGCTPTVLTPTPAVSNWGPILTLGQAEQSHAPALFVQPDRLLAVWVGADQTGVHQDAVQIKGEEVTAPVVLPLPPIHPYAQQLAFAGSDKNHLFWLDANQQGETRLYSALLSPSLGVERGPTEISGEPTFRYELASNGDGSVWAIWNGGLASEPGLFARLIDSAGRPQVQATARIVGDVDWLALAQAANQTVYLFWMRGADGRVLRTTLADGRFGEAEVLTSAVHLNPGDRLMSLKAGLDTTYGYLIWNVTRADGQAETWLTSGPLTANHWPLPHRLGIEMQSAVPFETGFNTGQSHAAHEGERWLQWAVPLKGQFPVLPLAAQIGDNLSIVYLNQGTIAGYQTITAAKLIGLPALEIDRNQFLYLAWSQPDQSKADLFITVFKP